MIDASENRVRLDAELLGEAGSSCLRCSRRESPDTPEAAGLGVSDDRPMSHSGTVHTRHSSAFVHGRLRLLEMRVCSMVIRTMLLRIDPTDGAPLYTQIAAAVRRAIADGEIGEGDRLPPARELALALDVNMHTVLRAYAELRGEGIIEMRRGRGSRVRQAATSRADLLRLVAEFVDEGRHQGLDRSELVRLVEREMS